MSRPQRCRRICGYPAYMSYIPEHAEEPVETVTLTLDEYETIRLLDLCGLTQGACAARMGVARTTVTSIYLSARAKIADGLVYGKRIRVSGGNVCVEPPSSLQLREKGTNEMRIAVTYDNGNVFQHFGRTAQFKLYDVENSTILSEQVVDTNGAGHGALAGFLKSAKADMLICGGIGGGAQMALANAGIRLFAGASGSADEAVRAFLAGTLPEQGEATCGHHEHHASGCQHDCH